MYNNIPDVSKKKVLCIGCGTGEEVEYLRNKGAKVIGIDISSKMIDIAKQNILGSNLRVMDMEHLDFKDCSFDFVYSSLAIHYLRDWTKVLSEIRRVLKDHCEFLFSINHPFSTAL